MRHSKANMNQLRIRIARIRPLLETVREPSEREIWRRHVDDLQAQLEAGQRQFRQHRRSSETTPSPVRRRESPV